MWNYLFGPLATLLPGRWRAAWFSEVPVHWPRAAALSGIAEAGGCLLALVGWYLYSIHVHVQEQMGVTLLATQGVPGEGAAFGMGFAALTMFALHPLSWALIYFSIEGAVRAFTAVVNEEVLGTLPLILLDSTARKLQRRAAEARVPLVPDEVTHGDGREPWDLQIASCRPKPHWKYPLAVRYGDEFFQVMGEAPAAATTARPHVYRLRRAHPSEALRGLEDFDPSAVLRADEQPTFFSVVGGRVEELASIWRSPLVADQVATRAEAGERWLEVASCRPKPDWTPTRLVRYEGNYYRVEGQARGRSPRPFVYHLRRLPAGVPGRNVTLYSPDEPLRRPR